MPGIIQQDIFPHMINLIQSAGMDIAGFSSDKADAPEVPLSSCSSPEMLIRKWS